MVTTLIRSDPRTSASNQIDCRICLLGGLSIEANGVALARLPTQKTGLLLAYLASFPAHAHPREELIEMLWPECELEQGRNRLRVALSAIRHMLEVSGIAPYTVIEADRALVRINPAVCTTDVLEFEAALRGERDEGDTAAQIAALKQAVVLYTGDMLPGYYEVWVTSERQRLTDLYASLLRRLGKLLVNSGEYESAIEYFRKALSMDPLSEGIHRTLIRLYRACQRPAAAQRQYETLKAVLARELSTTPSAQSQTLGRSLREGRGYPTEPEPPAEQNPEIDVASTLPVISTSFIGRSEEIAALQILILKDSAGSGRFITVTGPVGVGKSRLAIEAVGALGGSYDGRVFYSRISGLESPEAVLHSVADTLQIGTGVQTEAFLKVAEFLAQSRTVLVLDDADHLGSAAMCVINRLLAWAPSLWIVVTSTRVFGAEQERVFNLMPLAVPPLGMSQADLTVQPSVRLFIDRAQAARGDLHANADNFHTIIELCRRLEGIPLAIELAAAWMRVLTPESMLVRLGHRFEAMSFGRVSSSAPAGGLYDAISPSYQLMPARLRRLLARLSVLRGDWTEQTARAICGPDTTTHDILELSLRSFILCDNRFGEMRYHMLDTLRDYADEQLSPVDRVELQQAHAQFFETLGDTQRFQDAAEHSKNSNSIGMDYESYMAALAWRKQQSNFDCGVRLCANLWRYWYERGLHTEGLSWLEFFLSQSSDNGEYRTEALYGAGRLAVSLGEYASAEVYLTESLEICRRVPGSLHTVPILATLALVALDADNYVDAKRIYLEWLALPIQPHQIWERLPALQGLLAESKNAGDYVVHDTCLEAVIDILLSLGNPEWIDHEMSPSLFRMLGGYAFLELGQRAMSQDDDDSAMNLYKEGLECYRECGDELGVALACDHLASVSLRMQDTQTARLYALESLSLRRRSKSPRGIVAALLTAAHIEDLRGYPREAEVYRRDARRYSCEYEWIQDLCLPFLPA